MSKDKKIIIFDTTLRDGDQASKHTIRYQKKIDLAWQLYNLGVDVIEAGFPISSNGDWKAVHQISSEVGKEGNIIICGLSRAVDADIESAASALDPAKNPRIHTFIATSDIHIEKKLKSTRERILEKAVLAVQKAKSYMDDVEFSLEDFGRTDPDYALRVIESVIRAGGSVLLNER